MKIARIKPLVRQILIEKPITREDDFVLIKEIISKLVGNDVNLKDIAMWHTVWEVPSFESITRCRRAIQREQPELKDTRTAKMRAKEEELYHEEFKRNKGE